MVFRKDSKVDAFQRQISALRHQLGGEHDALTLPDLDRPRAESSYRSEFPAFEDIGLEPARSPRETNESRAVSTMPASLPPIPAVDSHTSVIAHTTVWNGNLESSGSLHIHGRVEGALTARDDIFVAEEAEIDASIAAANVTIAGSVRGSITCTERFEVLPRGRVAGDVCAPAVVIHEGAMVAGEISMAPSNAARQPVAANARVARGGD